jgi:cephalosporin hydroxylase
MEGYKMETVVGKVEELEVPIPVFDNSMIPVRDMSGDSGMAMAQIVGSVRYTDEDKIRWSKLIADFNNLYHMMGVQTWGLMRWRGVSLLKPPTDMWTYQELIHEIKPDLIIETGSYRGGSALFMRDILNMVYPSGRVISIDIDDKAIDEKAKVPGIEFYKGSSVDPNTIVYLKATIAGLNYKRVMVILDSDHSEAHVSKELDLYAPLVTVGSMLIVEDTSPQNNDPGPLAAVNSWALRQRGFKKNVMAEKFMLSFCRDGFWERME